MAYEFVTDASSEYPVAPQYWDSSGRIYHLFPDDPVFIFGGSVVQDPKTHQFAVDSNDILPEPEQVGHGKNAFVGLLKVVFGNPPETGYLIDLRYHTRLPLQRSLGLLDGGISSDAMVEAANKSVPVLGAIFHDEVTGNTNFQCQQGKSELLEPFAASLMEFVDLERRRRGVAVAGEITESTTEKSSSPVSHD